jgi:hypothetical protein
VQPIPEISGVERERFEGEILAAGKPVVMRDLVAHWPATKLGRQSPEAICRYLVERDNGTAVDAIMLPPQEAGRIFYNTAMDGFNFLRNRLPISKIIEQVARYSAFAAAPAVAVQSALIRDCLPRLLDDHSLPLREGVEPRIWLGNGIVTPAHFDESHNVACVIAGRRRFTLLPPEQIENLYVGPFDFAPAGPAISLVDFAHPNLTRFPRFAQAQLHALTAELGPGDAIYIPPLWWHHVVSLDVCNVLINYWWDAAPVHNAGLHCLTQAMISLRQLPPPQRDAWAAIFQYYVFGDPDNSVAHLPAERRGMLAPLTSASMRKRLADLAEKLKSGAG